MTCRALHVALGAVLSRGTRWTLVLAFPVLLAVMVSIFETHHVLEEAKLLKFAGATGCVWISVVWLLFLPSFFLLAICRAAVPACCTAAWQVVHERATGRLRTSRGLGTGWIC